MIYVTVSNLSLMRRVCILFQLVVFGGLTMMMRSLLVMVCCRHVVLGTFVSGGHGVFPIWRCLQLLATESSVLE